ncbi:MAG TPA: hypothetical protein VKV25_02925, partial [Acidimicrobiales bacterium]|nr:hypothetical protein [Acidimicrobiales bacterium]
GYNAALLAHVVGPSGSVTAVDVDADLVAGARRNLAAAGCAGVTVLCADGAGGWPPGAPYDRIILTVGAGDLLPAWVEQLDAGGRLLLPLRLRGVQASIAFDTTDGRLRSTSVVGCSFMPLRGAMAGPDLVRSIGPRGEVEAELAAPRPLDAPGVWTALAAPGAPLTTGVTVSREEAVEGAGPWVAISDPDAVTLLTRRAAGPARRLPTLTGVPARSAACRGLVASDGLALLEPAGSPPAFELVARPYGPSGAVLGRRLAGHVRRWDQAGRPTLADLRVDAWVGGGRPGPPTGRLVLELDHAVVELDWARR